MVIPAKQSRIKWEQISKMSSRNTSRQVCPADFDGAREMLSLLLKTVVVHNSVKQLMMETNLPKEGLVHCVLCAKSRRNCKNSFRA